MGRRKPRPIARGFSDADQQGDRQSRNRSALPVPSTRLESPQGAARNKDREAQDESGADQLTTTQDPAALCRLGDTLQKQGELDAAIAHYRSAIRIQPDHPEALNNLGNALQKKGNIQAAVAAFRKSLRLKPKHPTIAYNLGNALKLLGDLSSAIEVYRYSLKLNPNQPEALINLGNALRETGSLTDAAATLRASLKLRANHPEACNSLGCTLLDMGEVAEAASCFEAALSIQPSHLQALNNLGMAQLLLGDFQNGWKNYELRIQANIAKGNDLLVSLPNCPQWDGTDNDPQGQIVLVSEQGLGDTLQFMRYAKTLRERGHNVRLCATEKLHGLIRESGLDAAPLTPQEAAGVSRGRWLPLMSLPRILNVSASNPVADAPYIRTNPELRKKWQELLADKTGPVIGINWRGNRDDFSKKNRDIPLELLSTIPASMPCSLIPLQRGIGANAQEPNWLQDKLFGDHVIYSRTADLDDSEGFLDYAALAAGCDLIITTGTTVAHLAAGMGRPTWALLPAIPDWRWGLGGETTFWYPTMRLFRQQESGDWAGVIQRVVRALQNLYGDGNASQGPGPDERSPAAATSTP